MQTLNCPIKSCQQLNDDIYQVILDVTHCDDVVFAAGQYLELLLPSGEACAFSLASPPDHKDIIELHIRHMPDQTLSSKIVDLVTTTDHVDIVIPKGDCTLTDIPNQPIIFIGASTGFAQMKSLLEHCLENDDSEQLYLYWGVRAAKDLYLDSLPKHWQQQFDNFHYEPVVSHATNDCNWQGRDGFVHKAVLQDIPDLSNHIVYISGSPAMVYAAMDEFLEHGLDKNNIYSDVFSYAPRD